MIRIELSELHGLCGRAVGSIKKIYLHWTAGHYGQFFSDYHINIDKDGSLWTDMNALTEFKHHTYCRNTNAVGIALACAYNATGTSNLGPEPPTKEQIEAMAQVVACLCVDLGIPCDIQHVLTHAEAADNLDGIYPHEPYGPNSTSERWDLYVVEEHAEPWSGGDVIRGKAKWYANEWGSAI